LKNKHWPYGKLQQVAYLQALRIFDLATLYTDGVHHSLCLLLESFAPYCEYQLLQKTTMTLLTQVHAALVNLRLTHVEKHFGHKPCIMTVAREEDWISGWWLLVELDGDGHQFVFLVEVEEGNWCNNLQKCKSLVHF
jgi:hypothetical protein